MSLRMTTAKALIKFLDNQYVSLDGIENKFVEGIFTIFGHGIVCGLGQALNDDSGNLRVYQGRNEQGMAHTATGFARQSNRRRIIACASSVGPGAANMVTAAASATANNIPLLLFTGDTFSTRQPDPVLQQIEQFHNAGITTSDAFIPVTRYFDRVNRPEQLMSAMKNAMRILTDPEWTGSVCISLPQDVQGEMYEYPEYFFKKRVHKIYRPVPDNDEIIEAIELIKNKKKPLVILGGGVRYSESGDELLSFCEKFNIPFAETQAGKSVLKTAHPLNLGGIGVTGNSSANKIAAKADLIISVGTRLTDFTTGSKELFRNADVSFISINISRYHAEKLDALPIIGDAKVSIKELKKQLNAISYISSYDDEINIARSEWNDEMKYLTSTAYTMDYTSIIKEKEDGIEEEFVKSIGGVITQTAAIGAIRELIEKDAIVVGASGSLPGDLQRMWTTEVKDSYHMEYGYSCMGYEISAALGAKLAYPDRPCYAMVGDGAFMMLHSEAVTALQERKKIVILLFDNCGFGCINNLQMGSGMKSLATTFRYRQEDACNQEGLDNLSGALMPTDFAMIARGYGMTAYTAKTMDELRTALLEAKKQENVVLIDIKVLPKSMTDGYGAWWHVGIGESDNQKIQSVYEEKKAHLVTARKY